MKSAFGFTYVMICVSDQRASKCSRCRGKEEEKPPTGDRKRKAEIAPSLLGGSPLLANSPPSWTPPSQRSVSNSFVFFLPLLLWVVLAWEWNRAGSGFEPCSGCGCGSCWC